MSMIRKHSRLLLVALCCVAAGAGASTIAGAGAVTSSTHHAGKASAGHGKGLRALARHTVSGQFVVHTKQGYKTVTLERGTVDSVSGQQLKLTEGTPKAAYKTVTLTIPTTARVRDDHQLSTLSAVKPGQRVLVLQAPKRTFVIARTPKAGANG